MFERHHVETKPKGETVTSVKQKAAASVAASYSTDKTLFATRYKQGGRTVFGVAMTPAQIAATIKKPDPERATEGNRRIRPKHAADFGNYAIEHEEWVSPGIILRAPSIFSFNADVDVSDVQFGVLSYPERSQGDIQILDGQHRILGFHIALEEIDDRLEKARSTLATARRVQEGERDARKEIERLERIRDRLYSERVSVEIQVVDDIKVFKQMFFDIADNALGITASVKAMFDTRKVANRALAIVIDIPLLQGLVEFQTLRPAPKAKEWLSSGQLVDIVRITNRGLEGRFNRRVEREAVDSTVAQHTIDFFNMLEDSFPVIAALGQGRLTSPQLRAQSMLGYPPFLRVVAGVFYELAVERKWPKADVNAFFAQLAPHTDAPAHANSIWKTQMPDESFEVDRFSPSSRRQDAKGTMITMLGWALDKPDFLREKPAAPPENVGPNEDEDIDFALGHDTTRLAAMEAAETEKIAAEGRSRAKARSTASKSR